MVIPDDLAQTGEILQQNFKWLHLSTMDNVTMRLVLLVKLELSASTLFINLYRNSRELLILIRDDDYENDGSRKV